MKAKAISSFRDNYVSVEGLSDPAEWRETIVNRNLSGTTDFYSSQSFHKKLWGVFCLFGTWR